MGASCGYSGYGFLIAQKNRAGAVSTPNEKWITAENPLTQGSTSFPHASFEGVFTLETLGRLLRPSAGSPDIWHGKKCSDEAGQPVVGIRYVVEQFEALFFVELFGYEVGP